MLKAYKDWVKRHPSTVQNLDWLLYLTVWSPTRIGSSEYGYEAYHAAVGLLALWHQHILEEDELPTMRPKPYLWLDALEQVETLVELRAMYLERQGKMNRYGPLLVLEAIKAVLKMVAWSRYSAGGHLFLRRPSPDDLHQLESEQGMQDILASLERLRLKYTSAADAAAWHVPVPGPAGVGEAGAPGPVGSACATTSGAGSAGGATAAADAGVEGWDAHRGARAEEPHGGGDAAGGCCGGAAGSEGSEEGGSSGGGSGPGGGRGAGCGGERCVDACGAVVGARASGTACGQGQQLGTMCSGVREYLGERLGGLVAAAAAGLAGGAKSCSAATPGASGSSCGSTGAGPVVGGAGPAVGGAPPNWGWGWGLGWGPLGCGGKHRTAAAGGTEGAAASCQPARSVAQGSCGAPACAAVGAAAGAGAPCGVPRCSGAAGVARGVNGAGPRMRLWEERVGPGTCTGASCGQGDAGGGGVARTALGFSGVLGAGAGAPAGSSGRRLGLGGVGARTAGAGAAGLGEDPDAHMGRNLLWLSELLHIWRPVVYVTLLKRYGRRSWRPWLASLALDALSGHFHQRGRQHLAAAERRAAEAAEAAGAGGGGSDGGQRQGPGDAAAAAGGWKAGPGAGGGASGSGSTSLLSLALARSLAAPGLTAGEEREVAERRRKLVLYALRSPFLEATTLSWLSALRNATCRVPLVGAASDYLYGLVDTFTAYYSYTSGSN